MVSVLVLLNNYLHDLAAALLLSSMVLLLVLAGVAEAQGGTEAKQVFVRTYRRFSRFALGSLLVIVLGGVVRTITYRQYEWAWAAGRGQVTALLVKHVILFAIVIVGIVLWFRLAEKARRYS